MHSLKANFEDLLARIRHGRNLGATGFEPIYYLIFDPKEILDVKRELPAWKSRLRQEGWEVYQFSIAQAINDIIQDAKLRKIWLAADRKAPLAWDKTNKSLSNYLSNGVLQRQLEAVLEEASSHSNGIVLVTDLEALHPYTRIGAIETQLYGKFDIPAIFLYPGKRTGQTRLSFLGFYPEDGNYRSVHVGG